MAKKEAKSSKDKKSFFKTFKAELKKVIWPTPKQLFNNTMAVVAIVIILAAIVFVLDVAFEAVNKYGIDKIKESVVSTNSSEENTVTTDGASEENTESTEDVTPTEADATVVESNSDEVTSVENNQTTDAQVNTAE